MKLNQVITGCALAAGLMAFAASNVQAGGVVINNVLYSPANVKVKAQYVDGTKIKTTSMNSKQFLKELGFSGDVILTIDNDLNHLWVVNKKSKTTVADLSASPYYMFINYDYQIYTYPKEGSYTESGTLSLSFYNNGQSNESSSYFTVNGVYTFKDKYGKTDKNGYYNENENWSAPNLGGTGYDSDLGNVTVTGSFSSNGNGKILD